MLGPEEETPLPCSILYAALRLRVDIAAGAVCVRVCPCKHHVLSGLGNIEAAFDCYLVRDYAVINSRLYLNESLSCLRFGMIQLTQNNILNGVRNATTAFTSACRPTQAHLL